MFFLGAAETTINILKEKLETQYPGIRIAGMYSPPYAEKFSDGENQKMVSIINATSPDIVWVSLTAPKQDYWINEFFPVLHTKIAIGIGGALDVMAGNINRAPDWMQKNAKAS